MRGPALALLMAGGLASCGPRGPGTQAPDQAKEARAERRSSDPELLAIADEVDPGPQKPLLSAVPAVLLGPLEASLGAPDQKVAIAEVHAALMAWEKGTGDMMQRMLALGRGLILAERAVAVGSTDAELLLALSKMYAVLDMPTILAPTGIFQQLARLAAQMAQKSAKNPDDVDLLALVAGLREVFTRASTMHRRTAAEFLRAHGDHPEVPRVLGRLATDALNRERYPEGVRLREVAIRRLGERARPGDHVDAARTCYRALEPACGDAAQARAQAFTGDEKETKEHAERLALLKTMGERAHRAVALRDATDITSGAELGHLLLLLDRTGDAEALYNRLRERHPKDARPLAGLAKLAIQRGGDFGTASDRVYDARGLQNKDRDFYEVALGSVGVSFLYELMPQLASGSPEIKGAALTILTELREYADGFRAFDPARAAVVEAIVAGVAGVVPHLASDDKHAISRGLRRFPALAGPVAQKFPDSPDALRLCLLTVTFAGDAATALGHVRPPLPPALAKDPALQRARVRSWLDMTVQWEQAGELPALTQAIEQLPVDPADRERATFLGAVLSERFRRTGDRAAGEQALAIYRDLASTGTNEQRAVALNNAGVLAGGLGELQKALDQFGEALQLDPKAMPALMNMAAMVLSAEGTQRAELVEAFAMVAREGSSATLRLQALAWQHAQAERGIGDVEVAREAFTAALKKEREAEVRGTTPLGHWGLMSTGTFQASMYYSVYKGFEIRAEVTTSLWQLLPAPGIDLLVAGKAGKAGKPKPAAKARG